MLSEKEMEFIRYWEKNRDIENSFSRKLLVGLPMAMLFSFPVILSVVVVRLYFPDWYIKISQTSPGMLVTVFFAMVLVTLFYSFFRMQHKWESNEQLYKELKQKSLKK